MKDKLITRHTLVDDIGINVTALIYASRDDNYDKNVGKIEIVKTDYQNIGGAYLPKKIEKITLSKAAFRLFIQGINQNFNSLEINL